MKLDQAWWRNWRRLRERQGSSQCPANPNLFNLDDLNDLQLAKSVNCQCLTPPNCSIVRIYTASDYGP